MNALLDVERVCLRFGGLTALDGVCFRVERGEIVAVIGPNGAGKTSQFNVIAGHHPATSGRVLIDGDEIAARPTWRTAAAIAAAALAVALAALVAVNAVDLWQVGVLAHFRYREAFPWGEAAMATIRALHPRDAWIAVPFAAGLVVGGGGAWSIWRRSRRGADRIARAGVARTFQNIRLFAGLSARDNVLVGMDRRLRVGLVAAVLHLPSHRREERSARIRADELLAFVGLAEAADRPAGTLPYGHQRRLEIARALAGGPRLLLLDEPAAGMNQTESRALMELIRRIRDRGVTVLLIEHDMSVVMGVCDRVIVLHRGRCIACGTPDEVRRDAAVVEAYLGNAAEC